MRRKATKKEASEVVRVDDINKSREDGESLDLETMDKTAEAMEGSQDELKLRGNDGKRRAGEPVDEDRVRASSQSSTLKYVKNKEKTQVSNSTIDDVMSAISNLNVKVDDIVTGYSSIAKTAFEDTATGDTDDSSGRTTLNNVKKTKNIFELNEVCELMEFFYDESSEEGVLRCLPCFRVQAIAKPSIASLCPLDAQRILNKKGNGTLATGLLINKKTTDY